MNPSHRSYLLVALLAVMCGGSGIAPAELANPGFDEGSPGPVGTIGSVVRPYFQAGHWGAEYAYIVEAGGGVEPRSAPHMLLMLDTGEGMIDTQALQAVHVPYQFDYVELSAWANCETDATFGLKLHFFAAADGWPDPLATHHEYFTLDASPLSWERFSLEPQPLPDGTQWIVAEVNFLNASLDHRAGYVDDVELVLHGAVRSDAATWSAVKDLYRPAILVAPLR